MVGRQPLSLKAMASPLVATRGEALPRHRRLDAARETPMAAAELRAARALTRHGILAFVSVEQSADEIREALSRLDAPTFTSTHVLDRVPAIFESREQYVIWRHDLGSALGVDPLCIAVVGSTAVGVSLSPGKAFRAVSFESDVDVAVVSARHFDEAWRYLRSLGPIDAIRGQPDIEDLLRWHKRSLVFDGTIATERLLPYLPFGAAWQSALGGAARKAPTVDRDVKARIYRDFESLRWYQQANVESLKLSLVAND